jgi:putative DNA-invertase from lambdoid prophage Rac
MLHIYCRCSTADQGSDAKTSLQEQENIGMMFAQMNGLSKFDVQVYVDNGISGSTKMSFRPEGSRLLEAVQEGDTVIASKMDRIFRSSIDALQTIELLKAKGAHLVLFDMGTQSVMRDGPSKLFFSMLAAFAEFERGRIVERITLGIRLKKKRGGYTGGSGVPYGMRVVGRGPNAVLEPDPESSRVIELVREQMARKPLDFFSPRVTAREFTKAGIFSRTGKPFTSTQIARMARIANPEWTSTHGLEQRAG